MFGFDCSPAQEISLPPEQQAELVILALYRAAQLLHEFGDRIPGDSRPFAFNVALSLEQLLKAILARKKIDIPARGDGHDLLLLSERASLPISDNQKKTLDLSTATIIWSGRYPATNSESKWDEYQDFTFESHVIRTTIGNVSTAMANRDTPIGAVTKKYGHCA